MISLELGGIGVLLDREVEERLSDVSLVISVEALLEPLVDRYGHM